MFMKSCSIGTGMQFLSCFIIIIIIIIIVVVVTADAIIITGVFCDMILSVTVLGCEFLGRKIKVKIAQKADFASLFQCKSFQCNISILVIILF